MKVEVLLPKRTFERTCYRLCEPLNLCGMTVPPGFVTDGATVPRPLWWLFPPVGRYFLAAALHDYLLDSGVHWRTANRFFKLGLQEQGVAGWVVFTMFWAVQAYQFVKREVFRGGSSQPIRR